MLKLDYLKITRYIFVSLIAVVIGLLIYMPNYTTLKKVRQNKEKVQKEIDEINENIVKLKRELKEVEEKSFFWEKLARQQVGVVKKDEIVVDINR